MQTPHLDIRVIRTCPPGGMKIQKYKYKYIYKNTSTNTNTKIGQDALILALMRWMSRTRASRFASDC